MRSGVPGVRLGLRVAVMGYLTLLLAAPVVMVGYRALSVGPGTLLAGLSTEEALSATRVTVVVGLTALVLNVVFGIGTALLLTRHRFAGRRLLDVLVDIPQAVSPVVVGLALVLVYGPTGPLGATLARYGIDVIFSLPGMVIATAFVSLPLVVRAVVPVLAHLGDEQEQAARTLGASPVQTFLRVTLPSIKDALGYGIVLSLARSLGEYGAVAVVSGRVSGQTLTLTLFVDERLSAFDQPAAYGAAVLLAAMAVGSLIASRRLRGRPARRARRQVAGQARPPAADGAIQTQPEGTV